MSRSRSLLLPLLLVPGLAAGAPDAPPNASAPDGPPEGPEAPSLVPPAAPVRTFVAAFDDALSVRADILLEGVDAESDVVIPLPASWELVDDPVLALDFAPSPTLQAERSHLTVSLGDLSVASVRLDADDAVGSQLRVALPRALLQPYNHLRLRAVQRHGEACEDPFDPGLWTRVANASTVTFRYRERAVAPDLADFPAPLIDPTGFGPVALDLVVSPAPSAPALEALGRLGVTLGRFADWRGVTADAVSRVREARHHALLVGVWGETPEIPALLGDVAPKPGQGLVAVVPNPAEPTRAVLVVTGTDAEGLRRAALALTSRHTALSGPQARVDFVADGHPPRSRREPRPAPDWPSFPLSAIGFADTTVRGFYTPEVTVPIVLDGDDVLRPGGASAELRYSYAAGVDPRLSAMEVRLDGVTLKSVALDDPAGETGATVHVPLPDAVVTPGSSLEVGFTLFPKDWSACLYASDATAWATVHAASTLTLPRDGLAEIPDLGRLRYGLWPFSLDADGAVVAALPDRPDVEDVAAGFLLAAAFGRWSAAESPRFELRPAAGLDFAALADRHVVVLASEGRHALYDRLAATEALALTRGPERALREGAVPALAVVVPDTDALVAEILHPSAADRAVLVLAGSRAVPLPELVARTTSPEGLAALEGDVALVGPGGETRTLTLSERRRVGTLPVGVALVALVRTHSALLGLALVAAAVGLALVRRAWTRSRES